MQSETLKKTKAAKFFAAVLTAVVLASAAAAIPVCAVLTAGEARPVIVVDAGHGGLDGGVVGTRTGVKESDLNLAVALLLGGMLEEEGFDVVFTRAGKGGLYLDGERGKKSADMRRRADIIARSGAVGVVSIHMNTFSDPSRRGAQVFFDASSSRGRAFADAVQTELNRSFNLPDAGREFAALAADKFILQQTSAPSVIVECGFLSNPDDERNLSDEGYRARFALVLAGVIARELTSGSPYGTVSAGTF